MKCIQTEHYAEFTREMFFLRLIPIEEEVFRCVFSQEPIAETESAFIDRTGFTPVPYSIEETEHSVQVRTGRVQAEVLKADGRILWTRLEDASAGEQPGQTGQNASSVWPSGDGTSGGVSILLAEGPRELEKIDVMRYTTGGEPPIINRVKTVDGERNFIQNLKQVADHQAYKGRLHFRWKPEEGIYGLGQAEEGIYNYRGHDQYLYQHNMRIPMPVFLSDQGYGMLFDCGGLMTFHDGADDSYLFFDTISQMDYYFIAKKTPDEIIRTIRSLTGRAAMLPKWAFGYIQSKEQYYTAKELADVVRTYRELGVPLDCVVQDWNTWDPGNWGEKLVDKSRYGDLKERMEEIHGMHAHSMVSVWPNMNTGGKNHTELFQAGHLLHDYATYDAFSEEAREMYWQQAKQELFDGGFDSWWCDSTEPFSGPDWGGTMKREPWERYMLVGNEHKKYLPAEQANLFALMHAKGIYENQRKDREDIRVLNLTRSGYVSGQKYGAVLWSGDTYASWDTLKKQIAEGLNMGLSGYPYWTLDIGGFFTVGSKWQNRGCGCNTDPTPKWFWQGDYNEGVSDLGYRELYVRWLEMGTFLPMFRSHGTDTPREIWNFGKKGEPFYDAIEKYIRLRYDLMPYIYSLAGDVYRNHGTMMRSLLFDYTADAQARKMDQEFMFGKSLLVCPVTEPMYYGKENQELEAEKVWTCYLPAGDDWYHYWTDRKYEGGQFVTVDAPLDEMPVFVKAGSIIPMKKGLTYADEKNENPLEIHVYPGKDAAFTLYEDEGNNYRYEEGKYALTEFTWEDAKRKLTIGDTTGGFDGMENGWRKNVKLCIH